MYYDFTFRFDECNPDRLREFFRDYPKILEDIEIARLGNLSALRVIVGMESVYALHKEVKNAGLQCNIDGPFKTLQWGERWDYEQEILKGE